MVANAQCPSAAVAAENMTVMIDGKFVVGAGIIMAIRGPDIYIATAQHVVNDEPNAASITIKFRSGEKVSTNRIHKVPKEDKKDLAFLVAENREIAEKIQRQLSWKILRSRSGPRLSAGSDRAIIIGHGGEGDWTRSLEPERIANVNADLIKIQSTTIAQGFSGGGVFDPSGLLIGVILRDTGSLAEAIPITVALDTARQLGLPVDLRESDLTPVPVFIAPLTGVPEDWGQLIRENIRDKLDLQLRGRRFRLLECGNAPTAIRILGAVRVIRDATLATDVAIVTWQFNHLNGLANTPEAQHLEFYRLPLTDIWTKGSKTLSERVDEVGEYAVKNFMRDFPRSDTQ